MAISEFIVKTYEKYTGDSWHMILFLASLIVLLITVRKHRDNLIFIIGSLLFVVIYAWPVTADLIVSTFISRSVYWRMFWLLPEILVIALAGVRLLELIRQKEIRVFMLCMMTVLIAFSGSCVLFQKQYSRTENVYKLPEPTVEICDIIRKDAKEQKIKDIYLLVPNNLLCYIRQYDASIRMPYGRNGFKNEHITQNQAGLISQMSSDEGTPETMNMLLREEKCNYFVWHRQDGTEQEFVDHYDFELLGEVKGYSVYRIKY